MFWFSFLPLNFFSAWSFADVVIVTVIWNQNFGLLFGFFFLWRKRKQERSPFAKKEEEKCYLYLVESVKRRRRKTNRKRM